MTIEVGVSLVVIEVVKMLSLFLLLYLLRQGSSLALLIDEIRQKPYTTFFLLLLDILSYILNVIKSLNPPTANTWISAFFFAEKYLISTEYISSKKQD